MPKLVRIHIPANTYHQTEREAVYLIYTTERIANCLRYVGMQDSKPWAKINTCLYISYNEKKPPESGAKTGLCFVINVSGYAKKTILDIVKPILSKYWDVDAKAKKNFWLYPKGNKPKVDSNDLDLLKNVLMDEIEPALIQQGLI